MQDVIEQLGALALASRLKRLSDGFFQDAVRFYKEVDIDFEPRWFPVYAALSRTDEMSIMDLAAVLGITHPAVNQIAGEMIKKGLVSGRKCKTDRRKRLLSLTPKGRELQPKLEAFWDDVHHAAQELICSTGYDVMDVIARLEQGLKTKDFYTRVQEHMKTTQRDCVEIVRYEKRYKSAFEQLNMEWLLAYAMYEDVDKKIFDQAESVILKPGGEIFFARYEGEIVGTCALIKMDETTYELAKMAVTEKVRGKQIGKKLMFAAIDCARKEKRATMLILESNRKLEPAINLYRSVGFTVVPMGEHSKYQRADIRMQLDLTGERLPSQPVLQLQGAVS